MDVVGILVALGFAGIGVGVRNIRAQMLGHRTPLMPASWLHRSWTTLGG